MVKGEISMGVKLGCDGDDCRLCVAIELVEQPNDSHIVFPLASFMLRGIALSKFTAFEETASIGTAAVILLRVAMYNPEWMQAIVHEFERCHPNIDLLDGANRETLAFLAISMTELDPTPEGRTK